MMVMTRVKTTMRMMVSAPSELLFFTLKESGEVGFISLTGAQSHDLTLAGRSSHPSAVTYDPIEQVYLPDRAQCTQSHISPMTPQNMEQVYLPDRGSVHSVTYLTYDLIGQVYSTDSLQSITHLTLIGCSSHTSPMILQNKYINYKCTSETCVTKLVLDILKVSACLREEKRPNLDELYMSPCRLVFCSLSP